MFPNILEELHLAVRLTSHYKRVSLYMAWPLLVPNRGHWQYKVPTRLYFLVTEECSTYLSSKLWGADIWLDWEELPSTKITCFGSIKWIAASWADNGIVTWTFPPGSWLGEGISAVAKEVWRTVDWLHWSTTKMLPGIFQLILKCLGPLMIEWCLVYQDQVRFWSNFDFCIFAWSPFCPIPLVSIYWDTQLCQ